MKASTSFILLLIIHCSLYAQLVMPGDYPDPSVVKIGDTYWATATSSNWFPAYPLLKSKDLIYWSNEGYVFEKMPEWADYYFWAPEISYENGKVYVYYSAHKKNGNLCLSVASADKPEGPYTDHGPLMCQEVGSIDAWPMRDEHGKLFMIWKEDGNSVNKPTPIWAMEMKEDRTGLIGEKKELFRNDAPWEANLVEGVAMIRHGEYFYALYAAAGCCGRDCTYATGVARSKNLLGPWEKYEQNPILTNDDTWKCPGHGTAIEKNGRYYFLYHAYNTKSHVYTGREGLLKEFRFTADDWIEFVTEDIPSVTVPERIEDNFSGEKLSHRWQWSVFQNIQYNQQNGKLNLFALPGKPGAFLGQKTYSPEYQVEAVFSAKESTAESGLAAIGDEKNILYVSLKAGKLGIWKLQDDQEMKLFEQTVKAKDKIYLQMKVTNGKDIIFSYSLDGKAYKPLNDQPVDGSFLPPWDRAIRVGLISKGNASQKAVVDRFVIRHGRY
jgi:xylan 1,4-beta-xylosidase